MPFRAGSNRSNPSFFLITHRFDRTHARPERRAKSGVALASAGISHIGNFGGVGTANEKISCATLQEFPLSARVFLNDLDNFFHVARRLASRGRLLIARNGFVHLPFHF